jgi:hypothetical protein
MFSLLVPVSLCKGGGIPAALPWFPYVGAESSLAVSLWTWRPPSHLCHWVKRNQGKENTKSVARMFPPDSFHILVTPWESVDTFTGLQRFLNTHIQNQVYGIFCPIQSSKSIPLRYPNS